MGKRFWLRKKRLIILSVIMFLLMSIIPLRLAITFREYPSPQGILILAGELIRIEQGAQFCLKHPDLEVWVSSSARQVRAIDRIFVKAGIAERVNYDREAVDTVTNFTNMVTKLEARQFRHVYLVTSDYHLTRSRAIAFFVFGSHGIVVTPVATVSSRDPESWFKVVRDCLRCILWLFTGKTGASLGRSLSDEF